MKNEKELKLYFSLLSGDIYTIEADEIKNLDGHQIPLIKKPLTSCRKCYGRFYIGFNTTLKVYQICPKCANKCIDFKAIKNKSIEIETIKQTDETTSIVSAAP